MRGEATCCHIYDRISLCKRNVKPYKFRKKRGRENASYDRRLLISMHVRDLAQKTCLSVHCCHESDDFPYHVAAILALIRLGRKVNKPCSSGTSRGTKFIFSL